MWGGASYYPKPDLHIINSTKHLKISIKITQLIIDCYSILKNVINKENPAGRCVT